MSALESIHGGATRSEDDLVAAVRNGDDRAFGELYERYGRRIVSYVFGMVRDHGRAEDITQEVFISALRRMRETERPIVFKPWIYEIARNACIDEFRRTRRVREVPLATDDDDPGEADRRLVSHTDSPDATFERRQQFDDLRGAFRGLSDNHHKLIVMRELEGLSYDEIGERMGMTRPIVESTLFRARRRLNDEYQEIASGRRCEQVHAVIEGGAKSVNSLGIKERRRFARHVAHCQPCRRFARAEGFDDRVLESPGLASKIAALLPIPAFLRWRRGGGGGEGESTTSVGSHSFTALQSVQTVAQYADPASPAVGLGRAAAAVAAVVIAGGGVVGGLSAANSGSKPHVNSAPRVAHAASYNPAADQQRAGATRPHLPTATPSFRVASAKGSRTAGSSKGASTTSTSNEVRSSSESSLSRQLSGSSTSTALDRAGIGTTSGGSTTPSLPKLPLPRTNSLPSLPPVSVPVKPRPINIPKTVQKAVGTASKTVGAAVNTLNGVL